MSQLWTPGQAPVLLRHRAKVRTVTLSDGRKAKVTIDDSGTVRHTEHSEGIDALVRPRSVRIEIRTRNE